MKVLVAPCEFKETLTPKEAAEAVGRALQDAGLYPILHPVADGGGGTLDALQYNLKGTLKWYEVTSPTFEKIKAPIFYYNDFAFVEMAGASGLKLVPEDKRNPLYLTSYGTGELINYAIKEGYRKIYLGIGGSATVDGGVGMMAALGVKFYDENGNLLKPEGSALISLEKIDIPDELSKVLNGVEIKIMSDVKNPLLGKDGAVRVFGPQKGLKKEYFEPMEKGLNKLAELLLEKTGRDMRKIEGGGAAGGIGAALYALTGAELVSGAEFFLKITGFEEKLKDVEWVITGEGSFDFQSFHGKAPYVIAKKAKKSGKRVIVLCGVAKVDKEAYKVVDAVFSIVNGIQDKKEAFEKAEENLYFTAYNIGKLLKGGAR